MSLEGRERTSFAFRGTVTLVFLISVITAATGIRYGLEMAIIAVLVPMLIAGSVIAFNRRGQDRSWIASAKDRIRVKGMQKLSTCPNCTRLTARESALCSHCGETLKT